MMKTTEMENDLGAVRVKLLEDGRDTGKYGMVSTETSPAWTYTFTNLPKYKNGKLVKYTIQEDSINGYTPTYSGQGSTNVTITNKHVPERTQVRVTKVWDDLDDLDELRPNSITVKLLANGKDTGKTITLNSNNNSATGTFTNLYKYENGKEINYTVQEVGVPSGYTHTITKNGTNDFTITNKHTPHYDGYVEISGKVWLDGEGGKQNTTDGVFNEADEKDKPYSGVKVRLKDANGNVIKSTYTNENGELKRTDYAITDSNGNYTIRVNYDNSQNVYKLYEDVATLNKKLETAYVEFEYDGMLYTTVAAATTGANTSKAIENETTRNNFDSAHSTTNINTKSPDTWTDKAITAKTNKILSYEKKNETRDEVLKYCYGNGTYIRTNPNGAWKNVLTGTRGLACNSGKGHSVKNYGINVQKISNINLGLLKREQPDVAIFSDLTKVEATMNNQKYTYLYGVRTSNLQAEGGLKVKFQNKGTYTYKRPVNPADIAYLNDPANAGKEMEVLVSYQIKLVNLSSTLPITFNEIINAYDKNYEVVSAVKGNTQITRNESTIYNSGGTFKETKLSNLNITLQPLTEAVDGDIITITYKVNSSAIKGLLQNEATLNNATEISSFATLYGKDTLYAEGRKGGRTNKPYGGYDYNSAPGNARIKLITGDDGISRLYSTDINGNIIPANNVEDDTDIAPSFVLCKDETKKIVGTVWEDENTKTDEQRIGNGVYDSNEKNVLNVKVELYENNGQPAVLYNENGEKVPNSIYTDESGRYQIEGLVTGKEYYIKYTYGNEDNSKITQIRDEKINVRNYKSTIITDEIIKSVIEKENLSAEDKKWPLKHQKGHSIAVDDMLKRLEIPELKNGNYNNGINMTSYTKPFIATLEFEASGTSQVQEDGNGNTEVSGNTGVPSKTLDKFDFGIIERPRENLKLSKTISHFKIALANGQIIAEGDPRNTKMNYVKAMGFDGNSPEKVILAEIDTELIQNATLEVTYEIAVTNNNEIDYDYGSKEDYTVYDRIAKGSKANYYYYGDSSGLTEIKTTVKFADYMNSNLGYEENLASWRLVTEIDELEANGYISSNAKTAINDNKYRVLQTAPNDQGNNSITIARGGTFSQPIKVSKQLANKDENVFDNNAEIIEIDGKTARTVKDEEEYIPGNYEPSSDPRINENDDDRVKIIITPPTGLTNNITIYVISVLIGLVIVIVGIIFIKKKVLNN